jgi:hypothetical protein
MTSCKLIRSLMSRLGGYSNLSAAGSRLNKWTERPSDWACVMSEAQKVDLPAPAGPVTSTASVQGPRRDSCQLTGIRREARVCMESLLTAHVGFGVALTSENRSVPRRISATLNDPASFSSLLDEVNGECRESGEMRLI